MQGGGWQGCNSMLLSSQTHSLLAYTSLFPHYSWDPRQSNQILICTLEPKSGGFINTVYYFHAKTAPIWPPRRLTPAFTLRNDIGYGNPGHHAAQPCIPCIAGALISHLHDNPWFILNFTVPKGFRLHLTFCTRKTGYSSQLAS